MCIRDSPYGAGSPWIAYKTHRHEFLVAGSSGGARSDPALAEEAASFLVFEAVDGKNFLTVHVR